MEYLALKEAARSGNIDALYQLFREDPYLLEHIDAVPFIDTPLHTAAAAGQIDFAVEMLNLKPSCATKLNPDGFTPMHLALQNHQYQLLYELLRINNDLVRVKGKRAEINKYEALELLTRWLRRTHNKDGNTWEQEIKHWKDKEGNTMIKLLLECGVRKNMINLSGLTALDILQGQIHVNREAVGILSQAGAGLVITTTYQAMLNPPGGVRQAEASSIKVPTEEAGRSVMGASSILRFYILNTAAFASS
ncbi:hypothetical protein PTKIN_Ptkin13bG0185400 [Pterospermum kingtungense]